MKKVIKALKGHKYLLFMDFEATQFSHEMISLGAELVTIDKNGYIIKRKPPIKKYVKPKNAIGKFVENLTGITSKDIQKYGVSFAAAMTDLKKYCGAHFKKCSFIAFGNHDLRILNQSISYNLDAPKELCKVIKDNFLDFQSIVSEFIKDEHLNPLSLSHYLEMFNLEFDGTVHDPLYDAKNLATLYDAFMKNKTIVYEGFLKNISRMTFNPTPVNQVVKKLLNNESVSPEDFKQYIKDYIE